VAVSVISANLIVDLLYGVVDPRIRIDAASPST
jgi:ABC-type dipeptide/oligopeptide/nickel transport system permease component